MKINPKPERAPATDPNSARYWDERDLEQELGRVFEICHSCRMCVNFCGSFPDLFARVDRDIETRGAEGAELLDAQDFASVVDLCWQCKMCYIECPYTPDQGHAWMVDFPRVAMREKAHRAKRNGVSLQDRALGEPGKLGALASGPLAPMANFVNRHALLRKVNEKVLGISAEFPVPTFAAADVRGLARQRHEPQPEAGNAPARSRSFATCTGDYNFPRIAAWRASRFITREERIFGHPAPAQQCCGIPNLDGGDIDGARAEGALQRQAQPFAAICPSRNLRSSCRARRARTRSRRSGWSCSWAHRRRRRSPHSDARRIMGFAEKLRREKKLVKEFAESLGKVAYHAACHLRAQKIGTPGARVLGLVPDTEVEIVEKCSAVDGTWGMKAQYYGNWAASTPQKLVRGIDHVEPTLVVTDCSNT